MGRNNSQLAMGEKMPPQHRETHQAKLYQDRIPCQILHLVAVKHHRELKWQEAVKLVRQFLARYLKRILFHQHKSRQCLSKALAKKI
jgi:hypothetical protein